MTLRITLILLILSAAAPAAAWHETGHKATARIAFEQLTKERQLEIYEILRQHPRYEEDFLAHMPGNIANGTEIERAQWALEQASIWPDLMRDGDDQTRTHFHRSRWHYINVPIWLTPQDRDSLDGNLDHNMQRSFSPPLRQSLNAVQALRGNIDVWRDESASDGDKAVALCWILHIAGDIHQPLHTVALFSKAFFPKGDRGGNSIEVVWQPENSNLHAVWDGLPTDLPDLEPSARTLQSIDADLVDDAAIDAWVERHARLADRFVYTEEIKSQLLERLSAGQSPRVELSTEYVVIAQTVARRQVNLAGHRMAALIE